MSGGPTPKPGLKQYRKAEQWLAEAIKRKSWPLAKKAYDLLKANNDAYEAYEKAGG